jgi:hypothetical protein
MADQNTPQELVIIQCAFVITGEGSARRPRLLILSAPSVEGVDTTKLCEQWIAAAKAANTFPAVNNLYDNTGLDVASQAPSLVAPDRPKPEVRVNRDHPAFDLRPEDFSSDVLSGEEVKK